MESDKIHEVFLNQLITIIIEKYGELKMQNHKLNDSRLSKYIAVFFVVAALAAVTQLII